MSYRQYLLVAMLQTIVFLFIVVQNVRGSGLFSDDDILTTRKPTTTKSSANCLEVSWIALSSTMMIVFVLVNNYLKERSIF
ncbi:unnamed protein product [Schistosoma turkestanicum]|nr:unnamed protein product [Schistosoma turkestanicum]